MSATVTNHCFLLLKLNFNACNQFGLSVCVKLQMNHSKRLYLMHVNSIKKDTLWQAFILVFHLFPCMCVSICVRCMSCLSTRWKCYWDQENHLCVSSKDESTHNLLEVSNSYNINIPPHTASDVIQTLLSNISKCAVMI